MIIPTNERSRQQGSACRLINKNNKAILDATNAESADDLFSGVVGLPAATSQEVQDGTDNASAATPLSLQEARTAQVAGANVIYVSKEAAATDDRTGLSKYDYVKPFATLQAAINAAVSGDTVNVGPGEYTTTVNLAKSGVNWIFAPGATVTTGAASIFSDDDGAKTFSVYGLGEFVSTASGVFPVRIGNANSNVSIQADALRHTSATGSPSNNSACFQSAGQLSLKVKEIEGHTSGGCGVRWEGGDLSVSAQKIFARVAITSTTHAGGNMYLNSDVVETFGSGIAIGLYEIFAPNFATAIIHIKQLIAPSYVTDFVGNGLTAVVVVDKLLINGGQGDTTPHVFFSNGPNTHFTAGVVEVASGTAANDLFGFALCDSVINVGEIRTNGVATNLFRGSGTTRLNFGDAVTMGDGLIVDAGKVIFSGRINTSGSNTTNPIVKSGGTLILDGATLIAEATRDSISAPTEQNVAIYGTTVANKAADGDVTFTVNSTGFIVDADVE